MCTDAANRRPLQLHAGPAVAFALAILVAVTSVVGAAEPTLDVRFPDTAAAVGDPISIEVLARGESEQMWGELSVRLANDETWVLTDGPHEVPGSSPPAWKVTLVPLKVGELNLPEFEAGLRMQGGESESVTSSGELLVTVASVLGPEDQGEPAPLKNPKGVSGFPWEWVVPFALIALPVVLVLLWWRRRRRGGVDGPNVSRLAPFEELEQLLRDLALRIGREPAEVVCDRLASSVRHYLERRTGEPAAEMTSHELQVLARRAGWPGTVQAALLKVTQVADGARFGRRATGDRELNSARDLAIELARDLEAHFAPTPAIDEEVA